MENILIKNVDRFKGCSNIYEISRPSMPFYPVKILLKYLGRKPELVIDLGCGTGLSTTIWKGHCQKAIGIEPNSDMLSVAKAKNTESLQFISGYSHETKLDNRCADIVMCSQSFHWMEPVSTLKEINRILKADGIFAAIDYDRVPVSNWIIEKEYTKLYYKILEVEQKHKDINNTFIRYSKEKHLTNIKESGYFRYVREIVFANTEKFTSKRLIEFTLSQSSLQYILKVEPDLIKSDVDSFIYLVNEVYGDLEFDIEIPYRMRLGIK